MRLIKIAALVLGVASPAVAQETCEHSELIIEMADRILERRAELPRLSQARYGATATYLKLRYEDLTVIEQFELLSQVANSEGRAPRRFDDLTDAFMITRMTDVSEWEETYVDPIGKFSRLGMSGQRALILADEGETFLHLLSRLREDEEQSRLFASRTTLGFVVAAFVADQDDEFRLRFAQRAEAAGELNIATALLLEQEDWTELNAFMERHAGNEEFMSLGPIRFGGLSSMGVLSHDQPHVGSGPVSVEAALNEFQMFVATKAALQIEPSNFLLIYLNQTGQVDVSAFAAQRFLDANKAGEIDPIQDPEAAWLLVYESLREFTRLGDPVLTLSSFDWPSKSIRHFAGRASETLDWVIAKDAFGPYLRGESDTLPERPELLGEIINWPQWQKIAVAIRSNETADLASSHPAIVFEMYWEMGRPDLANAVVEQSMDVRQALRVSLDAMGRLDRQCQQATSFPGAPLRFGGAVVYDFAGR